MVDPSVSCTVVCHWVLNILSPIMPVWPTRIFALMSFGMTRFRFIFPFYLGLLPLASHINREQISMSRSEHFLSSLSNFFLDISFFCCHFQLLFRQEMYLSKLRILFVQIAKIIIIIILSSFPCFFSCKDMSRSRNCSCPNCIFYLSKLKECMWTSVSFVLFSVAKTRVKRNQIMLSS